MKKIVLICSTVLLGFSLTGCSNQDSHSDMRNSRSKTEKVKKSSTSSKKATVSSQESLANLKAAVSSPMNMENYQNIENKVIDAAKSYNDIIGNNDDASAQQSRNVAQRNYKSQMDNLNDLAKKADKDYKSQKSHLTSDDWKTLENYQNSLVNYLNELGTYASEIQNATPVLNDPSISEDTKKDEQTDLNNAQNKFNQAKQEWQNRYNAIMNRN